MAGSSPAVLLPSAGRWRSPILAAAVLPADLSAFMADRGDPPGGSGVVAGTTDGVAAGMVAGAVKASGAGTRPGWAEAATDIGAEEVSYVELITRTRRHSGGLAGALGRPCAIGSSAAAIVKPDRRSCHYPDNVLMRISKATAQNFGPAYGAEPRAARSAPAAARAGRAVTSAPLIPPVPARRVLAAVPPAAARVSGAAIGCTVCRIPLAISGRLMGLDSIGCQASKPVRTNLLKCQKRFSRPASLSLRLCKRP